MAGSKGKHAPDPKKCISCGGTTIVLEAGSLFKFKPEKRSTHCKACTCIGLPRLRKKCTNAHTGGEDKLCHECQTQWHEWLQTCKQPKCGNAIEQDDEGGPVKSDWKRRNCYVHAYTECVVSWCHEQAAGVRSTTRRGRCLDHACAGCHNGFVTPEWSLDHDGKRWAYCLACYQQRAKPSEEVALRQKAILDGRLLEGGESSAVVAVGGSGTGPTVGYLDRGEGMVRYMADKRVKDAKTKKKGDDTASGGGDASELENVAKVKPRKPKTHTKMLVNPVGRRHRAEKKGTRTTSRLNESQRAYSSSDGSNKDKKPDKDDNKKQKEKEKAVEAEEETKKVELPVRVKKGGGESYRDRRVYDGDDGPGGYGSRYGHRSM